MGRAADSEELDPRAVDQAAADRLPIPGGGHTLERWQGLVALGRADLCVAKVVEPHHDASAICHDLGHPAPAVGSLWEVWAAEPPGAGLVARKDEGGAGDSWRLDGLKPFCSGASLATHALVTAATGEDGPSGLFAVDLAAARSAGLARIEAPAWVGPGMRRADTRGVSFAGVPAVAVGVPGAYVDRPGFWHGAVGIAACWTGGTYGVAATLLAAARRRRLDPHALAHLGAVAAALDRCDAALWRAATEIDAAGDTESLDDARRRAESVRATVVAATEEVVARVGHALGPAPLAFDAEHAHRVIDLQVFCRQHHAERDLAALGDLTAGGSGQW